MSEDQPTTPAPKKRVARKRASDTATAADSVGKAPAKKAAKKAPKMAVADDSTATKNATRTAAPAKTARKSAAKKSAARKTPAKKAVSKAARQSVAKHPAGHATDGGIGTIEASNAGKTVVNPAAAKAANETIATMPPAATASTPTIKTATKGSTGAAAPAKAATDGGTSKANGTGTNRVVGTSANPATRAPDTAPARQRPATAPGTNVGNGVGNRANRGEHIRNGKPRTAHAPAPGSAPGNFAATLQRWRQHADPYLRLCRLDRPIGFLLLLWPTWWALWAAAEGFPPFGLLLIFTLGVVVMRSAGCVINDYADRWLDGQVKRTRHRPLPAGEVSPRQALVLFGGLLLAALLLVLMTNPLTIKLSVIGAFLAASYPFLKRYTHLPQIWLGMAFGWAIPMAFAAVTGTVPKLAWLLFIANILWATAYDTYYAMVDRDDDLRMGSKSTAILFGDMDLVAIAMLQGTFLLAMLFAGQQLQLGWPWSAALVIAIALVASQLWRTRHRDRDACFKAFLANNWVGMVLFVGLVVGLAVR